MDKGGDAQELKNLITRFSQLTTSVTQPTEVITQLKKNTADINDEETNHSVEEIQSSHNALQQKVANEGLAFMDNLITILTKLKN